MALYLIELHRKVFSPNTTQDIRNVFIQGGEGIRVYLNFLSLRKGQIHNSFPRSFIQKKGKAMAVYFEHLSLNKRKTIIIKFARTVLNIRVTYVTMRKIDM